MVHERPNFDEQLLDGAVHDYLGTLVGTALISCGDMPDGPGYAIETTEIITGRRMSYGFAQEPAHADAIFEMRTGRGPNLVWRHV